MVLLVIVVNSSTHLKSITNRRVRFKMMVDYRGASFVSFSPLKRGEGRDEGISPHIQGRYLPSLSK